MKKASTTLAIDAI